MPTHRKTPRRTRASSRREAKPARRRASPARRRAERPAATARGERAAAAGAVRDEQLGDLPAGYGEDALVALPRDPRSLYVYWDHAPSTLQRGLDGLDRPRVELRVLARAGAGWEAIRAVEVALDARGHYLHELEPGRTYRAELHAVDRAGRERPLGPPSGETSLPPLGPSPVVDDRFVRLPWDRPLGAPLGAGEPRPGFPDEQRDALARLSGRAQAGLWHGGSAALLGRPSSPAGAGGER